MYPGRRRLCNGSEQQRRTGGRSPATLSYRLARRAPVAPVAVAPLGSSSSRDIKKKCEGNREQEEEKEKKNGGETEKGTKGSRSRHAPRHRARADRDNGTFLADAMIPSRRRGDFAEIGTRRGECSCRERLAIFLDRGGPIVLLPFLSSHPPSPFSTLLVLVSCSCASFCRRLGSYIAVSFSLFPPVRSRVIGVHFS